MHSTPTAGISSIVVVLIGAAAIGAGALMSSNQAQSPNDVLVDNSTSTASSSVAISVEEEGVKSTAHSNAEAGISVEEEGVKRTVRGKEEASISSDPQDADDDNDTALAAESESTSLVTYSVDGFTPQTLEVSVGMKVRFENASDGSMWVASAVHPDHGVYDGTTLGEHCPDPEGDNFDQCEAGDEFSFTFNSVGEHSYHNHQNPEHTGTIVVTEE